MSTPAVSFSDLPKSSKRVADTVDRAQRVHVTRRDGEDLYRTTERHDRQREETADGTTQLFAALIGSDEGARAILRALPEILPWTTRHLPTEEVREFVVDLVNAIHDAAQLDVHANLHRVIAEWRSRPESSPTPTSLRRPPHRSRARTTARYPRRDRQQACPLSHARLRQAEPGAS